MLEIAIISAHPAMFAGFLAESIVARAAARGLCEVKLVDLRGFGEGRWRRIDDRPYGGGPGMLMMCGPWFAAVESLGRDGAAPARIIMTSPAGRRFTQRDAEELSAEKRLVFMCGHYEGFDARIVTLATDVFSVGDFVMTGGELAAAAMTDAVVRLLPGAIGGGQAAVSSESFSRGAALEAPQFTRPPEFRGMKVPDVLLSGDHARIEAWKASASRSATARTRPDLLKERPSPGD